MDQELKTKFEEQAAKIDAIYISVEKTRKYFLTVMWVTLLGVLLPMIGLLFVVPSFISSYTDTLNSVE